MSFTRYEFFSSIVFLQNSPQIVGCIAIGVEVCHFSRLINDYRSYQDCHRVTLAHCEHFFMMRDKMRQRNYIVALVFFSYMTVANMARVCKQVPVKNRYCLVSCHGVNLFPCYFFSIVLEYVQEMTFSRSKMSGHSEMSTLMALRLADPS